MRTPRLSVIAAATSGNWMLVAGGSSEKDWNALDTATEALGFQPHAVACQS